MTRAPEESLLRGWALFETALGPCGIVWSRGGVTNLQLPAADRAETIRLLRAAADCPPGDPPLFAQEAMAAVTAALAGRPAALEDIPLDLARGSDFQRRVWRALRRIGPGRTCTYGELAARAGAPRAARAVGRAVGANPCPLIVPCHRVLAAGGRPGGFSAPGGLDTKARLLALEGLELPRGPARKLRRPD